MKKHCPLCQKLMDRQSKVCRTCYIANHEHPENYLEKVCEKCGKVFSIHLALTQHGQGKYCSRSCARSGSPTRKKVSPLFKCATCGDFFNKYKSGVKKTKGNDHFCSLGCWYSFNQRDNHYLWSGGQADRMSPEARKWRRAVLKRDMGLCRICHTSTRLEAHHILPFRSHIAERWLVPNGVTLCHECHAQFAQREIEFADVFQFMASVEVVVWHADDE